MCFLYLLCEFAYDFFPEYFPADCSGKFNSHMLVFFTHTEIPASDSLYAVNMQFFIHSHTRVGHCSTTRPVIL